MARISQIKPRIINSISTQDRIRIKIRINLSKGTLETNSNLDKILEIIKVNLVKDLHQHLLLLKANSVQELLLHLLLHKVSMVQELLQHLLLHRTSIIQELPLFLLQLQANLADRVTIKIHRTILLAITNMATIKVGLTTTIKEALIKINKTIRTAIISSEIIKAGKTTRRIKMVAIIRIRTLTIRVAKIKIR